MIVLKYQANCKCTWYPSLRNVYRRCCSNTGISNISNSELEQTLNDSGSLDPDVRIENAKTKVIYSSVLHRNQQLSWNENWKLLRKQENKAKWERFKQLKEHLFPIAMKYAEELSVKSERSDDSSSFGTVTWPISMEISAELGSSYHSFDQLPGAKAIELTEVMSTIPTPLTKDNSIVPQDRDTNELVTKSPFKRNVSCGGCGARIQCEDQYNPGFIPLEFLTSLNMKKLSLLLCQRCYFTRSLKVSLQVNFNPISYMKELNKLKSRRSLILAVFDVTNISRNICSSISDFVGKGHPVILVGNKVDLLPPDSPGYLNRVTDHIKEFFKSNGHLNVKEVILVSSASGIGIENLITKLFSIWKHYEDIYLVGHSNVGKSSLFNALLNSDLSKATRSAGIQSATTSPWPGTTLGILKFPMIRPAGIFMHHRSQRLKVEHMEKKLAKMEEASNKRPKGYIASPDIFAANNLEDINCEMGTTAVNRTVIPLSPEKLIQLGMSTSRAYKDNSRWCHDTPGIPHPDRTLDLLTPDEMRYALPGPGMIIPRTYYMKEGLSLFIGGLARIDHNTGDRPIRMTIFASSKLPVLICTTTNAEEVYTSLLGTHLFGVPRGDQGRLGNWPPLASKDYEVVGISWKESCADVLLSSAGWVAITAGMGNACGIRAHTPGGLGIDLRIPSLMPHSVLQKASRKGSSPVYPSIKEYFFTRYLT